MAYSSTQATTMLEQFALRKVGHDRYESVRPPARMGNSKPIAYGGCTTAVAVYAACQTVDLNFRLYSVLGLFLGPALVDRCFQCQVSRTRDTKSFSTRQVVISQILDDGSVRKCLELSADFQVIEPATLYAYSPNLVTPVQLPNEYPTFDELKTHFVRDGRIDASRLAILENTFSLMTRFWEVRTCTEGVGGQNLGGFAKSVSTTQDNLHMTDKVSMDWQKSRSALASHAEQMAAVAFNMDGGLSFLPLLHDHKFLEDAGACSSLDFALRIFAENLNLSEWHLKERRTVAAQGGRTYSEARLFDRGGNLVAIESQQSIMRPLPTQKSSTKL